MSAEHVIERVEPILLEVLRNAEATFSEAQQAVVRAEGALLFTRHQVERHHRLGPKDEVDPTAGTITRVPAARPPQDAPV